MDRVINMLKQKYDYPIDDIKVSSIGKLEMIDFDIADDRKVSIHSRDSLLMIIMMCITVQCINKPTHQNGPGWRHVGT